MIILILVFMFIIQIIYWVALVTDLTDGDKNISKTEFWIKLIPFLFVIHIIIWFIKKYESL